MAIGMELIQSLSQIKNIIVVPSKHQISVNPHTGKKERIFVDLAAIYPTPEEQGTELSFEEIMAANRGWLDESWDDETIDESLIPEPEASLLDIDEVSNGITEKLMIHQDSAPLKLAIHKDPAPVKLAIHKDSTPVKLAIHKDPVGEKLVIHQDSSVQKLVIHKDLVGQKIPIHQDNVVYDENGAVIEPARPPRGGGKKKKVIEVNETQISRSPCV